MMLCVVYQSPDSANLPDAVVQPDDVLLSSIGAGRGKGVITKGVFSRAALKGTNQRGQTPTCGLLRVPAVFCGFLRQSVVLCENLRLPDACFVFLEKARISKTQRVWARFVLLGLSL